MTEAMNRAFKRLQMLIDSNSNATRKFSTKYIALYKQGSKPQGIQEIREISKIDMKLILKFDFNIDLQLLNSSQRNIVYRKLRSLLIGYPSYGSSNEMSLFMYVSVALLQLASSPHIQHAARDQLNGKTNITTSRQESNITLPYETVQISDDDEPLLIPMEAIHQGYSTATNVVSPVVKKNQTPSTASTSTTPVAQSDHVFSAPFSGMKPKGVQKTNPLKSSSATVDSLNQTNQKVTRAGTPAVRMITQKIQVNNSDSNNACKTPPRAISGGTNPNVVTNDSQVAFVDLILSRNSDMKVKISCPTHKLYSLQMDLLNESTVRFAINDNQHHLESSIISPQKLFYWPGIAVEIKLGNVSVTRQFLPNYERHLTIGTHNMRDSSQTPNVLEMRRVKSAETNRQIIPKRILDQYLAMVLNNRSQRVNYTLFRSAVKAVRHDIQLLRGILLGQTYSYFLLAHPYGRYFANSAVPKRSTRHSAEHDVSQVRLFETINPEVQFTVTACPFIRNENEEGWTKDLFDLVKSLFAKIDPDVINNTVIFECKLCDIRFDGTNSYKDALAHVKSQHNQPHAWRCTQCDWSADTDKLAEDKWCHQCD